MGTDNPLFGLENCLITPHVAWASFESRQRLLNTAVNNTRAFLDGHPVNDVTKL
jgi:glycerate dehydrogenase